MPQVRVGEVELCYESMGEGTPLLLVMGIGVQLVFWPDDLCRALAERGFTRVIAPSSGFDSEAVLSQLNQKIDALAKMCLKYVEKHEKMMNERGSKILFGVSSEPAPVPTPAPLPAAAPAQLKPFAPLTNDEQVALFETELLRDAPEELAPRRVAHFEAARGVVDLARLVAAPGAHVDAGRLRSLLLREPELGAGPPEGRVVEANRRHARIMRKSRGAAQRRPVLPGRALAG